MDYNGEKYLEMLFDSAESESSIFGFNQSFFELEEKFKHWWDELYQQRERY